MKVCGVFEIYMITTHRNNFKASEAFRCNYTECELQNFNGSDIIFGEYLLLHLTENKQIECNISFPCARYFLLYLHKYPIAGCKL